MTESLELSGRRILVTGGTSGIGLAAARLFRSAGAQVVGAGTEAGVERAREADPEGRYIAADLTEPDEVEAMIAEAVATVGGLDVAYSNAGLLEAGTATETTLDRWSRVLAVNLTGQFLVAKHAIPHLRESDDGALILTASDLGLVGSRAAVAYCAAKGGVVNMTRALAVDCAPDVRVNCLAPGATETPMLRNWFDSAPEPDALERAQIDPIPMRRAADPTEIARAALFLASRGSSYMTGATLLVDGGVTAWYGL